MAEKKLIDLVLAAAKPGLDERGYHLRSRTFSYATEDVTLLIEFQSNMSSTKTALKYTVNLGAYSTTIGPIEFGMPLRICVSLCHWNNRLGSLLPERSDTWWTVGSASDSVESGRMVAELIAGYALPVLDTVNSTDKIVAIWRRGMSPGLTEFQRIKLLARVSEVKGEQEV